MSFDDSDTRRAEELVRGAEHSSVSVDWLTGRGGHPSNSYLFDDPLIDYLDADEQPHAVVYNERKGVGVGEKGSTIAPDAAGITIAVVTDRRTLVVVGKESGDETVEISHTNVTAAEYHTGIMKHRISIEVPRRTYHVWVNTGYDENDLRDVVQLIGAMRERGRNRDHGTDPAGADSAGSAGRTATSDGAGAGASPLADDGDDAIETLKRLKQLNRDGVITDEEFEEKKAELLEDI